MFDIITKQENRKNYLKSKSEGEIKTVNNNETNKNINKESNQKPILRILKPIIEIDSKFEVPPNERNKPKSPLKGNMSNNKNELRNVPQLNPFEHILSHHYKKLIAPHSSRVCMDKVESDISIQPIKLSKSEDLLLRNKTSSTIINNTNHHNYQIVPIESNVELQTKKIAPVTQNMSNEMSHSLSILNESNEMKSNETKSIASSVPNTPSEFNIFATDHNVKMEKLNIALRRRQFSESLRLENRKNYLKNAHKRIETIFVNE